MKRKPLLLAAGAALALAALAGMEITTSTPAFCAPQDSAAKKTAASQSKMSFREDVAPIFKGRCESCHQSGGDGTQKSGLDLTTYAGLLKGTKFGAMVVP